MTANPYETASKIDINEHLGLVQRIAKHIANKLPDFIDLADLTQAGYLGLISAAEKFQPSINQNFEAYAQIRIRGAIIDEIRQNDWTPRTLAKFSRDQKTAIEQLTKKLKREPIQAEVAEELGLSSEQFNKKANDLHASFIQQEDDSLYQSIFDGPQENTPENNAYLMSLSTSLKNALGILSEKELQILNLYYYEELTQAEIAPIFDVSEKQISNLRISAEKKLKKHLDRG